MARAYSLDLRERVVAAVVAGVPRAEVMRLFGVGRSTVRRLLRLREQRGSLAPRAGRPGPPGVLAGPEAQAMLAAQLAADGDARIEDHRRLWQAASRPAVSAATMWRAVRALGWRHKKSGSPPASATRRHVPAGGRKTPA